MAGQLAIVASVGWAIAAAFFVGALMNQSVRRIVRSDAAEELEQERRRVVRSASGTYRHCEPLVADIEVLCHRFVDDRQQEALTRAMDAAAEGVPWRPLEHLACKIIEGSLAGVLVGAIFTLVLGALPAIGIAIVVAALYAYSTTQSIKQAAAQRIRSIKHRLPFAVDLMALMLEAGAGFQEALRTVVRENAAHPLGAELGNVVRHVDMGRPRKQALEAFQNRIADQDVTDLIAAINKGEELGTPLSTIMRTQADQMRLKRSQWGEKAAAEAQVQMTFPSMLIMLACMLLVLGPFVLPAVLSMF